MNQHWTLFVVEKKTTDNSTVCLARATSVFICTTKQLSSFPFRSTSSLLTQQRRVCPAHSMNPYARTSTRWVAIYQLLRTKYVVLALFGTQRAARKHTGFAWCCLTTSLLLLENREPFQLSRQANYLQASSATERVRLWPVYMRRREIVLHLR